MAQHGRLLTGIVLAAAVVVILTSSWTMLASASARSAGSPSWHHLNPTTAPGARDRFGMAFDPMSNTTILFGGYNPNSLAYIYGDTWSYSGGNWTQLSPSSSPSARSNFVMVYDSAMQGIVLFGGYGASMGGYTELNDTWLWSHGTWKQLFPLKSPSPREIYGMAYDANNGKVVLFGGESAGTVLNDTWVFNGSTWTSVAGPAGMPARKYPSMAYDAINHEVVLVGGQSQASLGVSGTWAFHGKAWTHVKVASGPAPLALSMPATAENGSALFFGGILPNGNFVKALWEFNSGAWHQLVYPHGPSVRMAGGLVYDPADGYMLEFGGVNALGWLGDTWALY
jgi:hypothetical protein